MLLSLPKIVLQMIALRFQDIVIFIICFPPTPACTDHLGNGFIGDEMIGDERIVVEHLAINLPGEGEFAPIDE